MGNMARNLRTFRDDRNGLGGAEGGLKGRINNLLGIARGITPWRGNKLESNCRNELGLDSDGQIADVARSPLLFGISYAVLGSPPLDRDDCSVLRLGPVV